MSHEHHGEYIAEFAAPTHSGATVAAYLEKFLIRLVEIPAALLVFVEVVVLMMGVIWRYVLHQPLIWSDELAGILFLWLAMLGSVISMQRGDHMRMTAIVGALEPKWRSFLDLVAIAAAFAFLCLTLLPAYNFAAEEIWVTTPALEIPIPGGRRPCRSVFSSC